MAIWQQLQDLVRAATDQEDGVDTTLIARLLSNAYAEVVLNAGLGRTQLMGEFTWSSTYPYDYSDVFPIGDIAVIEWISARGDNGISRMLTQVSPRELEEMKASQASAGETRFYAITGDTSIAFYPAPKAGDRIDAYVQMKPFSFGGDWASEIPYFPEHLVDVIALGAIAVYARHRDHEAAAFYEQRFQDGIRKVRSWQNRHNGIRGGVYRPQTARGARHPLRNDAYYRGR